MGGMSGGTRNPRKLGAGLARDEEILRARCIGRRRTMLNRQSREMSMEERQLLADAAGGSKVSLIQLFILFAGIPLAGLMTGALAGVLLDWLNLPLPTTMLLIVGAVGGLFLAMFLTWKEISSVRRQRSMYKEDLAANLVDVLYCQPLASVRIEEYEDEGPGFFLDVGDGDILFLQGQYLDETVHGQRFPSSAFRLQRAPKSNLVFSLECTGQYQPPMRERRWLEDLEYLPMDQEILQVSLTSLDADLAALKKAHRKDKH